VDAGKHRALLRQGVDPISARQTERGAARLAAAGSMTFRACTEAYIEAHRSGWRNAKHAQQWRNTLQTYAFPIIGELPVQEVGTASVMQILKPLWNTKTETASRLRGRIEAVLDWATAQGFRQGENPARWRGHLDNLLRLEKGVAARGLEFKILTATRTGEVIGARWTEIDEANRIWTVPAERMKAGRKHRVALSSRALTIVREIREIAQSEFVFPGLRAGKPLSNMSFLKVLDRMDRSDITRTAFGPRSEIGQPSRPLILTRWLRWLSRTPSRIN
jgi:integrase